MSDRKSPKRASPGTAAPSSTGRNPGNYPDPPVVIDPDDGVFEWASTLSIKQLREMFPPSRKEK